MSAHPTDWAYRGRQLWLALFGRPDPARLAHAADLLRPEEYALFRRLQANEQAHALNVLRDLEAAGQDDPLLLKAALLHDVGKARHRLTIFGRVTIVLGEAFFPGAVARWGAGQPRGLRRPFGVAAQHPTWGAELAQAAGCDPALVALIAAHQSAAPPGISPENTERLRTLQAADNEN